MRVELTLVDVTAEQLVLEYGIHNDWGREIYLLNRLFQTARSGQRTLDPNAVYVQIAEPMVTIVKALVPVPEWLEVERPEVPYLTRVEPDGNFSERVVLDLPVVVRNPYSRHSRPPTTSRQSTCKEVGFAIGYVTAERNEIREVSINDKSALAIGYATALKSQRVITSEPVEARCPCVVDGAD